MDALFIVGPNGRGNEDLRLALRSFAKFGRGVARVCASGYLPDWLSGEVAKFDLPDLPVRGKWKSIINRIVESVHHFDLRGDFICCSDDILLTMPVDFTDYPRYMSHSAMPKEVPDGKSNRNDWRALVETRRDLRQAFREMARRGVVGIELHRNREAPASGQRPDGEPDKRNGGRSGNAGNEENRRDGLH